MNLVLSKEPTLTVIQ